MQRLIASQREPEQRDEQQQQRKQRKESVVRQQCREPAGAVVTELLHDRKRKREDRRPLLTSVDAAHQSFQSAHTHGLPHNGLPEQEWPHDRRSRRAAA